MLTSDVQLSYWPRLRILCLWHNSKTESCDANASVWRHLTGRNRFIGKNRTTKRQLRQQQTNNKYEKNSNSSYTNKWRCNTLRRQRHLWRSAANSCRFHWLQTKVLKRFRNVTLKKVAKDNFWTSTMRHKPAALPQMVTILNVARSGHNKFNIGVTRELS